MKKKNPTVAAMLSFVFGPLGYLYIGWRYAVLGLVVFLIFTLVVTVVDFPLPTWTKFITVGVLAWKGWTIVAVRNAVIDDGNENAYALGTWPLAAMAMSDLLVGMGMLYAGALGFYAGVRFVLEGSVFRGALVILLGTPLLIWVSSLVFGIIATGIDALAARGMKNLFRR